jgi:thiamine biosynthesis lipoprotein
MEVAEHHGRVMASRLHLIVVAAGVAASLIESAVRRVVLQLEDLERCWSRFVPSSDVSRINALGPNGGDIEVDPSTVTLLRTMLDGYHATAGRYDPTLLRAVIAEGYDASTTDGRPVALLPAPTSSAPSLHALELNVATNVVSVPPGLVVDPGGIGKGLAADLAVTMLLDAGVAGAMVEIGGDLAMAGAAPDPSGWLVDVEHPDPANGMLCSLAVLGSGGVATSSVRSRRWVRAGFDRHHQIDPRTGACSTTDLTAVTVIAPTGWLAEVHATAALALGRHSAIDYLEGHGLSVIAVAESASGDEVWATGDLADLIAHAGSPAR